MSRVPGPARSDWKAWVGRRSLIVGPRIGFLCNPIRLKFSTKGKRFPSWEAGQSWGLRLYQSGYDNGLLFTIRLKVQPIQTGPSQGIGHTPVLVPREPTRAPSEPSLTNTNNPPQINFTEPDVKDDQPDVKDDQPNVKDDQDLLLDMTVSAYRVLDSTRPDPTDGCW